MRSGRGRNIQTLCGHGAAPELHRCARQRFVACRLAASYPLGSIHQISSDAAVFAPRLHLRRALFSVCRKRAQAPRIRRPIQWFFPGACRPFRAREEPLDRPPGAAPLARSGHRAKPTSAMKATTGTAALQFFPGFAPRRNRSLCRVDVVERCLPQGRDRGGAASFEAREIERLRIREVRGREVA